MAPVLKTDESVTPALKVQLHSTSANSIPESSNGKTSGRLPLNVGSTPTSGTNMTETKPPVPRTAKGQFPAGVSGNPLGRAKGTKNKITLARLLLESELRDTLTAEGPKLMRKAIKMAMGSKGKPGNDKIMRVLLDKMLATPRGDDSDQSGDRDVKVIIENHSGPKLVKPAIEGQATIRISPKD